jgi:nicotinamidase-related amidase
MVSLGMIDPYLNELTIRSGCGITTDGWRIERLTPKSSNLTLNLRRHNLDQDANGHRLWREVIEVRELPAARLAIIICDMWDNHWSRGAAERVTEMAPRMNGVIGSARAKGVHIIHAPSDTLEFYAGTPARVRAISALVVVPPTEREHADPPLPIDDSDAGSDTGDEIPHQAWSRQHAALEIDPAVDAVSADGREIYSLLHMWHITQTLIMGVHTNMCVLNRPFAIKQMVRWNTPIALVRDLTDTMYNPARSPYVSHAEGTALVVGYIERFWCPTIESADLIAS